MKNLKLNTLFSLVLMALAVSFSSAQSTCDKMTEKDFSELETMIAESATQVEIVKKVESLRSKIKRCGIRSRESQPHLTEKLDKLIASSGGKVPANQDKSIDFSSKNQYITKMQEAIDRYHCLKEDNKVLTKKEIEVLKNYEDDGSSYYKTNIMRGQNYLKSLENRVNREEFIDIVKKHIDNKAKSINEDLKKEYKDCFYSTLQYIENVALPGNENLKIAMDYLELKL